MAYPFPDREIEKVENRLVMLPHDVDGIQSYAECENAMSNAAYFAAGRAKFRNNPNDLKYAEFFNKFAHQDRSVQTFSPDGSQRITYYGGCKLLLTPNTRQYMWRVAKEHLRQELLRFHTNQAISNKANDAQVHCQNLKCYPPEFQQK